MPRRSIAIASASILVAGVVLVAFATCATVGSRSTTSPTLPTTNSTIPGCAESNITSIGGYGVNVTLSAGKTLNLCMKIYYYSAAEGAPATVNLTSFASLDSLIGSYLHSALTNFTMGYATSQGYGKPSSIQIGGTSNENEGFLVEYQITPKAGVNSGSYDLNLGAYEPDSNGGLEGCATDFLVVLGDGAPNYDNVGSCITVSPAQPFETLYTPGSLVATAFGVSYTDG